MRGLFAMARRALVGATALLALLLLATGCGEVSPTSPTTPSSLTGTWVGGTFFKVCVGTTCQPTGTMTLHLTESDSSLTGNWTSTQGSGLGPYGTMMGNMTGSTVIMLFALGVSTPDCTFPIKVVATLSSDHTQMTGTYSTVSCSLVLAGDITLTKQ